MHSWGLGCASKILEKQTVTSTVAFLRSRLDIAVILPIFTEIHNGVEDCNGLRATDKKPPININ